MTRYWPNGWDSSQAVQSRAVASPPPPVVARAVEGEPERRQGQRHVDPADGGVAEAGVHAPRVVAIPLGVADRLDDAPGGIPGQARRQREEERVPVGALDQPGERPVAVGRPAAATEGGLRRQDPDGRVDQSDGGVAEATERLDPGTRLADRSLHAARCAHVGLRPVYGEGTFGMSGPGLGPGRMQSTCHALQVCPLQTSRGVGDVGQAIAARVRVID